MLENFHGIGFFGIGKSNLSLMRLERFKGCALTLRSDGKIDRSALPSGVNIERIFEGENSTKDIDEEILFFSPSVRRDRADFIEAAGRGVRFSSDAELFFEENKHPVFAVTGSDGKSTTASLLHLLLKEAGKDNRLVGNIGEAMCQNLGKGDSYVCELSSFMLTYLKPKVRRACITNISPNHLDWHESFEEYKASKLSLLNNADECVLTDKFKEGFAIVSPGKSLDELNRTHRAEIFITIKDGFICRNGVKIISLADIKRREKYNLNNLMLAIGMADGYVDDECIRRIAESFPGLAHRCELVMSDDGVDYFNSSIDSSPTRTQNTIEALGREVVLILGGKSKGLDYSLLLPCLKKYARKIIITGENAEEIYSSVKEHNPEIIRDFKEAVLRGKVLAKEVGALLLSPASTSYDCFKNYEERGAFFKEILLKSKL